MVICLEMLITFIMGFNAKFCLQIQTTGDIKNHLAKKMKNKILGEKCHFWPKNNNFWNLQIF